MSTMWIRLLRKEIAIDFLKPFQNRIILKFIGLYRKFNLNHVKAFYYRMETSSVGIQCRFNGKLIKFGRRV